jgi:hypothetical protein
MSHIYQWLTMFWDGWDASDGFFVLRDPRGAIGAGLWRAGPGAHALFTTREGLVNIFRRPKRPKCTKAPNGGHFFAGRVGARRPKARCDGYAQIIVRPRSR